jgi:hypothetical protein
VVPSPAPAASATESRAPVGVPSSAVAASGTGPQPLKPGVAASALRVTLRGLEDTWVRYTLDRKPPMEILMRPAESASFDAEEEVRLTIGKSQGVSVYLNDEEVVLPAERNRLVADLVLNKLSVLKLRN